jgi:membrane fusion protein YbhG
LAQQGLAESSAGNSGAVETVELVRRLAFLPEPTLICDEQDLETRQPRVAWPISAPLGVELRGRCRVQWCGCVTDKTETSLSGTPSLSPERRQHDAGPASRQAEEVPAPILRPSADVGLPVVARSRRAIWLIAALLIIAGAGYGLWQGAPFIQQTLFGPPVRAGFVEASGNIEAHQSVLSFTQIQAPIVYLPFDEGAVVKRGTVLARVDDRLYQQQVEIDRTNLAVAAAQITANQSTLAAARHSVASDGFDLAEKQRDSERAAELAKTRLAGSIQARDLADTAAQQAAAVLAHDQAIVEVAKNNVTLAEASQAAVAAKLKLDQITVSYTVLESPFDGVISVREAELGQLAGPGVAIFTLDDLDHPWLRGYVNEPDIGKVRLGERVAVTTDTYPGKVYQGRIAFIAPDAEFTPKTVETHAERVTLVYRIRIDIANPTHELLPGMPADARIKLLPAGK